jgi:hypothetical protein
MCAALQGEQHRGVLAAKGCPASNVHSRPLLLQCLHGGNKVRTTAPVERNPSDGNDRRCCEGACPAEERARAEGIRIVGGFRPSGCVAPSLHGPGLRVPLPRALARFPLGGAGGGEGVGAGGGSSASNTVIGGGEGEWTTGGEGDGVGNGGGGGEGRDAPMKSPGCNPAAIISKSSSSPTKMRPGGAVSSGYEHCPSKEASSVGKHWEFRWFLLNRVTHHRGIREFRPSQTELLRHAPSGPTNPEQVGTRNEHRVPLSG